MSDSNPTRNRYARNKKSFQAVLGDPVALSGPEDGLYNILQRRSDVSAMRTTDEGQGTPNPARPTALDFFCDVENVVQEVIKDKETLERFSRTYIACETTGDVLTQAERNRFEQRIGQLFLAHKIVPLKYYFISKRTRVPSAPSKRLKK